ncbi:MAG TPA: hypothetical protein VMY37_17675 [Thermoguttaceae bacterium]|nr:hypothetical protein [Thermoguttaceae bacterium]
MSSDNEKTCYRQMIAAVRQKRDRLPVSSQIRLALPDLLLKELRQRVDVTSAADLRYSPWPPLVGFMDHLPDTAIGELDGDLELVIRHGKRRKPNEVSQFLRAKTGDSRAWYGGLFDVWAKATLVRQRVEVDLDVPLPNGRDTDIRVKVGDRHFRIEGTVITQDDESRDVWDRFVKDKRADPTKILMRPGPYDPHDAKGPGLYYNALRFYAKVYDKIAKKLDADKSQCADDEPNVLLVSFAGAGLRPNDPGWGWALDELFDDQPSIGGRLVPAEGLRDISLSAWVDFTASELCRSGEITVEDYDSRMADYTRIMSAPRRLGGILVFRNCELLGARVNYNARQECRITHAEMAELERLLSRAATYSV